jgi:hypothetical protein
MTGIRLALGALMVSSAAFATAPAFAAGMDRGNDGPDNNKPCRAYLHRDLPAPRRCYRAFRDAYGPKVIVRGGMVFRDHGAFAEFREGGGFRDYDRWAERQEDRERKEYDSHYAENTPQHRDQEDGEDEQSSGGASYGHRSEAAESPSGGASAGHKVEKSENYSGGASSH